MKSAQKLKSLLLTTHKHIKQITKRYASPEVFLHKKVPYFSQWESPGLVNKIIAKEIEATEDPLWRASGAKTKQEYNAWSWSGCGMACTKMVLASTTGKVVPLVTLGKKCLSYGGYKLPLESSPGLFYKPYFTFVRQEFGWRAKVVSSMGQKEIMYQLSKGNFVIASVSPHIRNPSSTPKIKGGHLVLLLGYDRQKQQFYLHNPSGTSKKTQNYAAVSFADFKKFFSGRGIVIDC